MTAVASEKRSVPKKIRTIGSDDPRDWMTDMLFSPSIGAPAVRRLEPI